MHTKLKLNTITSLLLEVVAIISGFILPRLFIGEYGSSINGLLNSITQFIGVITFLEFGVGKVVQSSLYKPLAEKDNVQISRVLVSADKFFKRIAQILFVYIITLMAVFPYISGKQYDWLFSATLIAVMSISSFAQYYFGLVNSLLLTADQRGYISSSIQIIAVVLNTLACYVLIKLGFSIQVVKLVTAFIFLARPVYLAWYVRHHFAIDYSIQYDGEPIKQKWNGFAQHIAYVVLNSVGIIVLTAMEPFSVVSVYSVYHLVVYGVKKLFTSMMGGVEAFFGTLWARQDLDDLERAFGWTEWLVHTAVVFVFGSTAFLIVPFVQVYTRAITDANYIQPLFAALFVLAHACHCLRLPYILMIFAAGHYKETQSNHIIATISNIIISVIAVKLWGLTGAAIGTLVSMLYQTIWMAIYNSNNLVKRSVKVFVKQAMVDVLTIGCYVLFPFNSQLNGNDYVSWCILLAKTTSLFLVITVIINTVFYRNYIGLIYRKLLKR